MLNFIKKYNEILFEKGYQEADEFKNTMIPDVLFKYFPCKDDRIAALKEQKLWLAKYNQFNDKHEFEFMYSDRDGFRDAQIVGEKWKNLANEYDEKFFDLKYEDGQKVMEAGKKLVSVACFTTDPQNNYFWSEYAKNSGFCVEYSIQKKDYFYPVIYTNEKLEISDILKTTILEMKKNIFDEKKYKAMGKPIYIAKMVWIIFLFYILTIAAKD